MKQLSAEAQRYDCLHCGTDFPLLDVAGVKVPWLLPEPDTALLEWKARLNGFLARADSERARLRAARGAAQRGSLTEQRLTLLDEALAARRETVVAILAPLGLDAWDFDAEAEPGRRLANKLPANQGLSSYLDNLFRDWAWDNGENEALADIVLDLARAARCRRPNRIATLGAGACRLPYDVHRRLKPAQSIVVDFNPLLLLSAVAVMRGQDIALHELPLAPKTLADTAKLQRLKAPQPLALEGSQEFLCVFGDVTNLPFAEQQMDLLVTPWLIDIVGDPFETFVRRVNAELVDNGLWINTGSLAFLDADPTRTLSADEALEIVEANGFELVAVRRDEVPYLCSPLSGHGRRETLLSFAARRRSGVERPPRHRVLPAWLIDLSLPIPDDATRAIAASEHLLLAQVLGAADGQRSVERLGMLLAEHHGTGAADAIHAVRRIFVEDFESREPVRAGAAP